MRTTTCPNGLNVFTVTAPLSGDFDDIVTNPCDQILVTLAQMIGVDPSGETNVALVLIRSEQSESASIGAAHEALFESLRGIVGALTLECPGQLRINLIRSATSEEAQDTLELLDSDAGAFIAGATLDLIGEFE